MNKEFAENAFIVAVWATVLLLTILDLCKKFV